MGIKVIQDIIDKIRCKEQRNKKRKQKSDAKKLNEILKNNTVIKLNLGCGPDIKQGWINIDNDYYHQGLKSLDFDWDLLQPIPFPDKSVDYIFNEHFIEHFTYQEGLKILENCARILKDTGVIRIATPDLAECVRYYVQENWREPLDILIKEHEERNNPEALEWSKNYALKIKTRGHLINNAFREEDGSHKWLYDFEEITRLANDAGFTKVRRCENSKSSYPELCNIENHKYISTLVVEIEK